MIDKSSLTWGEVTKYIAARNLELQKQICGGTVNHEPGRDDENRARLRELDRLIANFTKPEKPNE
jgi:hypothetical protein